jgi:hypothetical protein
VLEPLIPDQGKSAQLAWRLAESAAGALHRMVPGQMFAPLGEALMWLIALDDLLASANGSYRVKSAADTDGAALPGVRYARNAIVHGHAVTTTTQSRGGAMLGAAALGTFALGEAPSARWIDRTAIGFTPKPTAYVAEQERSYDSYLDGNMVDPPLQRALLFLRAAAGV